MSTLFLLVIVSLLGTYMVNLNLTQQQSSANSVQAARAFYIASSVLDWALYQMTNNPGTCPSLPSGFQLEGFDVAVDSCTRTTFSENSLTYAVFDIEVVASQNSFGDADYVSRSLRATIEE